MSTVGVASYENEDFTGLEKGTNACLASVMKSVKVTDPRKQSVILRLDLKS